MNWEVESRDETHVTFLRKLPQWDLEVRKTFRLATLPEEEQSNDVYPAYHLVYRIEIRNRGTASRRVIYRLEGPNGLPTEGWWYASKVSRNWGGAGLRDVIVAFNGQDPLTLSASGIAQDQYPTPLRRDDPMHFVGVDAQYFSAVLLRENADEKWTSEWQPIHYGEVPKDRLMLSNTSFRVTSVQREVPPGGALEENFQIFAGPRSPALLAEYGLNEIVYYGWFKWAAIPMLWILHGFYYVIPNYGIAIILLTVLVRGAMYPLSHKQALSAQKMQEIQPELKRLQEKYKNNLEARGKAQQELFKKHNYNPMGGCLIVFLQLPIFVGLYRALMVDVELRQAPLITESIRWASNLASPDMLFDWSGFMPEFITRGTGMFGLGPYFNLLPIFAIVLFLWQQKKFMPPPADEQAALQQKMMQYMMVFMGILFFKVASGLCLYFIASSLWSIAERQYLPKTHPASNAPAAGTNPPPRRLLGEDRRAATAPDHGSARPRASRPPAVAEDRGNPPPSLMPYATEDTIVAIASARGGAARGIVRLSGSSLKQCLDRIFQADHAPAGQTERPTVHTGRLRLAHLEREIPCELYFWPGRRSYTGEPAAEFHTLGSPPLLDAVVRACCAAGARGAEPGEFTLRAFLAGRLDLTQAEAVLGVIDAADPQQLHAALAQLAGGLAAPLGQLREQLLDLLAHIEAGFDFADEDLPFLTPRQLDLSLAQSLRTIQSIARQMESRRNRPAHCAW